MTFPPASLATTAAATANRTEALPSAEPAPAGVPDRPAAPAGDGPCTPAGAATLERLRRWPGDHQVVVGLSGGVDSSLTAALLVEAGWRVEGLTLWLMSGKGACCAEGLVDAVAICEQLGIPHHLIDFRAHFQREIVSFLVEGYGAGLTPLPCSRCNRAVKFGPMVAWARDVRRIDRLATGHYARVRHADGGDPLPVPGDGRGRHQLLRGLDRQKDQSYFLYDLPQAVLGALVFPLGEMAKEETRQEAARLGLRTAAKPESQDLCLAEHHGSMKAFLDAHLAPRPGEITLPDGTVVGRHDGIEHFTIGQRRGLGVAWREPLHVVRLDGALNRGVVAPRAEATRARCQVGAVNWVAMAPPEGPLAVEVQVRYRTAPEPAWLVPLSEGAQAVRLDFAEPQFSITPGQAAVFYAGDVVLGGGLIQP
ncbi:MAG: tRNA 2-thiouridine(34) synthase MnmA [Cyanobacteriota bacterium]